MNKDFIVYSSNRLEVLAEILGRELFAEGDAFTPRMLVVPSTVMQNWLTWKFAKDPCFQMFMGVEVLSLKQATELLSKEYFADFSQPYFPDKSTLALAIEPFLSVEDKGAESRRLSGLFQEYGVFGQSLIENSQDLQIKILRDVFNSQSRWGNLCSWLGELKSKKPQGKKAQLHLFGQNFVPKCQLSFFEQLSQVATVRYYELSPSSYYFGDVTKNDLTSNRLLSTFGSLGREMQKVLEGQGLHKENCFVDPGTGTTLTNIQNDLLEITENATYIDDTIEIHRVPSRAREIEVLYDKIHEWTGEGIELENILVMAPDIGQYSAHIQAIFGTKINHQIYDLSSSEKSRVFSAIKAVINLTEQRFDVFSVEALLEHPLISKSFGITVDEIRQLQNWLKEENIRWGYDAEYRKKTFENTYQTNLENSDQGSWSLFFTKLIKTLGSSEQEGIAKMSLLQIPFFGAFISKLEEIKTLLEPTLDNKNRGLTFWGEWLWELWECISIVSSDFHRDEMKLYDISRGLIKLGESSNCYEYSFESIQSYLFDQFEKRSLEGLQKVVKGVRFCSILPMRAIPSKVVVLLGMKDGEYPNRQPQDPKNLLRDSREADFSPAKNDFDRYLFIEALLSARRRVCIFAALNEDEMFSPYVDELRSYIKMPKKSIQAHPLFAHQEPLGTYLEKGVTSEKDPSRGVLEPFSKGVLIEEVTIHELERALKDPMGFYVRKSFNLHFERSSKVTNEDLISLNALEKSFLKRESILEGASKTISKYIHEGKSPTGSFGNCLWEKDVKALYIVEEFLKTNGVNINEVAKVDFIDGASEFEKLDGNAYISPPLNMPVKITGTLKGLSSAGLILDISCKTDALIKKWPSILLYLFLTKNNPEFKKRVLCTKDQTVIDLSKVDPEVCLKAVLEYATWTASNPHLMSVETYKLASSRNSISWDELFDSYSYPTDEMLWMRGRFSGVNVNKEELDIWKNRFKGVYEQV